MKKTKIICTAGPSSSSKEVLKEMIKNGMDAVRLNLSHASYSFCGKVVENINELNDELNTNVSTIFDIKGPEIRVGKFENGVANLEKDSLVKIYKDEIIGTKEAFSLTYPNLINDVNVDDKILLNDGLIELTVTQIHDDYIVCKVENDGEIEDNKGVNVPNVKCSMTFLSEKDKEDIKFASSMNADFIALSYTSCGMDVLDVSDLLIELNDDHVGIISKIENASGVEDVEEIIRLSDGIMIARGDLGVEVPMEKLPTIQKSIIEKCHEANKISIVATEMLASMEENMRPTRAEVSDVANAVLDGADAVMLSNETAVGNYPIETVEVMSRILESTEEEIDYIAMMDKTMSNEKQDTTGAISYSVVDITLRLKTKAIVTATNSGYTARKISRFRPSCPIIATSPSIDTVKSLTLNFAVYPVLVNEVDSTDEIINNSKKITKDMMRLEPGDKIIITGGIPLSDVKHTNFIKVEEI
jgi:pyruvate kinase